MIPIEFTNTRFDSTLLIWSRTLIRYIIVLCKSKEDDDEWLFQGRQMQCNKLVDISNPDKTLTPILKTFSIKVWVKKGFLWPWCNNREFESKIEVKRKLLNCFKD